MNQFKSLPVTLLLLGLAGCCNGIQFAKCPPPPARLVDVNTERGDAWGRNFYDYRTHELHPNHVRRYDYHPKFYHRFVQEEDRSY